MTYAFTPRIMSVDAAAHYTSLSKSTLHRLTDAGQLRTVRISEGRIGYLREELDRYINDHANIKDTYKNGWDERLADAS
tara:strand:- start:1238 stop:1474 length:237 start_codon:yes stop_codon:yes gene_type:complete